MKLKILFEITGQGFPLIFLFGTINQIIEKIQCCIVYEINIVVGLYMYNVFVVVQLYPLV